jgi:preprotein translocase subunit SecG
MVTFLTVLHICVCVFLIIVVLLQAGKGGGMGIAFGGGGSQTVFGSSGAGNFLTKLTSATAFIFLVTSLGLAHYSSQQDSRRLQRLAERKQEEKKVEDAKAAKLKEELDKAREGAKKPEAPAPNSSEMPAPGAAAPPALNLGAAGKAGKLELTPPSLNKTEKPDTKAAPAGKTKGKAKTGGDAPAKADDAATPEGETPKPKKKRRAAPPADGESAPAAPPAEAPAAPTQ